MSDAKDTVVIESFVITFDDYNAMLLNQPSHKLTGWKSHMVVIVTALLNIGLTLLFVSFDSAFFGYPWISYINGALGVFILLMSYVLRPIMIRRHYAAAALKDNPLRFEADGNSMRSSRKGLRSEFDWRELVYWTETENHFFFWINKIQAVIVPKRALADEHDKELLRRFAIDAGVEKK